MSPFDLTLIERSTYFNYDNYGTRTIDQVGIPHVCGNRTKLRNPSDFVARKNAFYQHCRNSDIHYEPLSSKKADVFATIPSKLEVRLFKSN